VILAITNREGITIYSDPIVFYAYGLANSPWPKFAHDQHNSGISENPGPMMNTENADSGGAFPRYWRGGIQNDNVNAVCIGYDGMVVYTQGEWLRARTPYGGVLWDIEFESKITAWPAILHDGSIVFGTYQGWVHRINMDGTNIWSTHANQIINDEVKLYSAVNVGHDGTIYIGGYQWHYQPPGDRSGRFFAFNLDGELRWMRIFHSPGMTRPVPVIGIDQNIILNGPECNIYTSEGSLINSFGIETESGRMSYLGPACVTQDGTLTLTSSSLPQFSSSGEFLRNLLDRDLLHDQGVHTATHYVQAPIVDFSGASIVVESTYHSMTLVTISNSGDMSWVLSNSKYSIAVGEWGFFPPAGAVEDSEGRIYAAYQGIRAFSPIEGSSIAPFSRRFSLWTYSRPTPIMSAPAIGEDGWLYVGCGDDILAIGD
jgi:outer membrane protein assembly factor BamB